MNVSTRRYYRMTDDGRLSAGSEDLDHLKRLREEHLRTSYESPYQHLVMFSPLDGVEFPDSGMTIIGMLVQLPWDYEPRVHDCDPGKCCTTCRRHTDPHKGCILR